MPSHELIKRTYEFAVAVGKLTEKLPFTILNRAYIGQIVRSSSSTYANYRASQRAKSDRDFINKLKIVEEECDETIGFLELLKAFNEQFGEEINLLIDEGNQLLKIFVASITTMRTKMALKKNTGMKDS
jgi:four helix bundle protein